MAALSSVLELIQDLLFLAVGVWALVRWRRDRTEQSRWLALAFLALALAIAIGLLFELAGFDQVPGLALRVVLGLLAVFPWVLLRFLASFEPVGATYRRAVAGLTTLVVVGGFLLPTLPRPRQLSGDSPTVYLAAFVVLWTATLPVVAWRFWRAGKGHPDIVRRRLRLLAIATAGLSLGLLLATAQPGGFAPATVGLKLVTLLSAVSFLIGFAPPGPLRVVWREPAERRLHDASVRLMAAATAGEVARLLVPHARQAVGASAVALVQEGEVLAADGAVEQVDSLVDGSGATWSYTLSRGALHVWSDPYTPFFGSEEFELLERATVLADLALARVQLLENEERTRRQLERGNRALGIAHAELEVFVSSVTHDLKAPLTTLVGFLDLLARGVGGQLDEQGRHFVARMQHSADYMQELIEALLELFRVGQSEAPSSLVDLDQLVREVAAQVIDGAPGVGVKVAELPMVWMNELRCRQLFINLLSNAAHHNGGVVTIEVEQRPLTGGAVELVVRDDGAGVQEQDRERVFGVFERGDGGGDGTGIGLAICRKIVEGVGGTIALTDHQPGAEFLIRLPAGTVRDADENPATSAHLGVGADARILVDPDAGWSSSVSSPGS